MHVGGNSHYKKQSEVRRPGIFFINTISKTVFLQFLPSSKSSHSNCDATYKLYSWIRVREIFWNKPSIRNMPLFAICFNLLIPAKFAVLWSALNLEKTCFWPKFAKTKRSFRIMGWYKQTKSPTPKNPGQRHPVLLCSPSTKLLPVWLLDSILNFLP